MSLLGAVLGAGLAAGVWLILAGMTPVDRPPRQQTLRTGVRLVTLSPAEQVRGAAALAGGLLAAYALGWVAAPVLLPVAAVGVPRLLRPTVGVSPERLEAMEEWVRNLAGVLGTNTSLATGITRTLSSTPEEIRPEVEALVARVQARRPLTSALYAFADDLDDQTGDYVATALIQASQVSGAGLTRALDAIASATSREVRTRREILVAARKATTTVRVMTLITAVLVTGVVLSPMGGPYRTPVGQLVLLVLVAAFGATLAWHRASATVKPPSRFLTVPRADQGTRAHGPQPAAAVRGQR